MCTVTYLPTQEGCLITSNRDETVHRGLAEPPAVRMHEATPMVFPRDPLAGGTWIASSGQRSVCLFNGAFEPHERKERYRMSRGLVPLACLAAESVDAFLESFDFEGIEPFSLVIYADGRLREIKWDESVVHQLEHDPAQAHIWASVPLYDEAVRAQRARWFREWLHASPRFDQENVMGFHTQDKGDAWNGLLIQRDHGLQTVSVTSIAHRGGGEISMKHHDLVKDIPTEVVMG